MYYKFRNISIYYEKYGDNTNNSIIIFPGWGNTRNTFYNIINTFKDSYSIYIFDYPGFGNSDTLMDTLNIYDYALLFYNFILDNNINNPNIIAHSFGGRIVSLLIGKYSLKVNKLVLFDVAGIKRFNYKVLFKRILYKSLRKVSFILPKKIKVKYNEYLISIFASSDYKNVNFSMRNTFKNIINEDLRNYYKLINCETLLLWGENDLDTPLKDGLLINKYIDNSAIIVYKNSGHFSYLDYPIHTNNILISFFK